MSCDPKAKKGSVIRSALCAQTSLGGGSEEPGAEKSICQTMSSSATTISGGTVLRATVAASARRSNRLGATAASGTTAPVPWSSGAGAASFLATKRDIGFTIRRTLEDWREGRRRSGDCLDFEAVEIGSRVRGIEDLAVEEGLDTTAVARRQVG